MIDTKVLLNEDQVPKKFYNILPDLPEALAPPLNPGTKEPINPSDLEAIFPKEVVRQEVSSERFITIPDEVREALLRMGRPSPLIRAKRLEEKLKTPARIYFKHEGLNPCGSHKPNTAIAQTYYNMKEGVENLATETGAGQWGTSLAYATMLFGLKCTIFMVRTSFSQKPYRKSMIGVYGATVHPSPSTITDYGKKILKETPEHPGSLGIAISEAIETVVKDKNKKTKYSLGSVLNHVLLHQTVIGQETREQLAMIDEKPDYMIGCVGGGSNFGGIAFPLIYDKIKGKNNCEFVAVEPVSCPSTTKGEYRYDFGDTAGMTPLIKMYTLGKEFVPSPIHAGGLRYHGMAPTVSLLVKNKMVKSVAYHQKEVFEAAMTFAQTEGIIAAPESSHAIKAAIDKALECKRKNEQKTIVFNLSGHGLLDLGGYDQYLSGKM
ncbi:Tryptophan synthase beta chain 2 [Candidatus Bilamarchaeum dharawalense]|uniref:Tryptophan synthase beta chain n=1 Tax=Candidatus Bilamarchaeum dharawalense TaxID=2885759 RepID=A0A5E4LTY7_9ARCH|nr:Tryptophan synthase beta chain 2 [Candidatus Bilamarchaeum dharawalense]